jgi:hypothetical protein
VLIALKDPEMTDEAPTPVAPANALDQEIAAYEKQLPELQKIYLGKFVVFKGGELIGAWDTLNAAAAEAVARFGRGPYLIRQVGSPRPTLPASVLFRRQSIA